MKPLWISLAATLVADQASKYYILEIFDLREKIFAPVVPPYLNLHMAWNTGVNFGLFGGYDMRWIFVAIGLMVSFAVLFWITRAKATRLTQISAGLLIGGAFGNIIDRIRFGAVVDFLNMSCCGISNPYAFNIADVAIFAGAIGLIFFAPAGGRQPPPRKEP